MAINKVEFGGRTLIDLTDTTATADKILTGYGAYGKDGVWVDGTAIESSPDGAVYQDSEGYVVLDDGPGTHVEVESLNVTENGTYTAPTGYAYSPVSVGVEPNVESLSVTPTEEQQVFNGTKYTGYYTQTFSNYIGGGTRNINYNESMVVGNKYRVHVKLYYLDNTYYPTATIDEKDADITLSESEAASVILFDKTIQRGIYFYPTFVRIPSFGSTSYEEIHFEVTFYNQSESLDGYLPVTVNAISSTYVGSGITKRSSTDLTVSGPTVTVPAGYYSVAVNKSVASAIQATPTMAFASATGLVTATATQTSGYVSAGTKSSTYQLPVKAAATYTPTETAQTIGSYQWLTGAQTIAAISSTYVGTGVTQRSAADMTVNGSYVTAPSGYYSQAFSKAVSLGLFDTINTIYYSNTGTVELKATVSSAGWFSSTASKIKSLLPGSFLPNKGSATYTPGVSDQVISSRQWLEGSQTILGDANLVSSNIKSGVSIFGVVGTVPDENNLPTVYRTWDDSIGEDGGYVYSCNYTHNQIISMLTTLNGNPLAGELHDITNDDTSSIVRAGGTWIIDYNENDPVFYAYPYDLAKFRYCSDGSFEVMSIFQIKNVTPSRYAQYVFAQYPYDYLSQVTVSGDNNLVSSNIRAGVSIFGVQGTLSADRSFENNIVQRKYISSYVNNDISMIGAFAFTEQTVAYMECLSVKNIYSYAFRYAGYGTFSNGMSFPSCSYLGEGIFYGARISKVSFPSCITIGESCFYSCSSLAEVSFPNCRTISQSAFYLASKLISADFPHVTSIEQYAFYGCFQLISISFPECSRVGNNAFQECRSLENVYLPILNNSVYSSCKYLFARCSNLSSINLPAMTTIGQNMFYSCPKLENVSIPLCESIFDSAFYNCTSLSSISFPLCTSIYSGAFLSCTNLIDVNLPALTTIQYSVFENCTALESISLPLVQTLMPDTFFNCKNLKNVSLPVCSVFGARAFYRCSSLTFNNIYAPSVTKIGESAFANCIEFSEVFYSNITFEGTYAFTGCQNLTSVTFIDCPGIWNFTFVSCYNLLSLYLLGSSVTALSNRSAFNSTPIYNYTASTGGVYGSIYVPASLYDSYRTATNWTTFSSRFVSLTDAEIAALNT